MVKVKEDQAAIVSNFWNFLPGYEYELVEGEWRFETLIDGLVVASAVFDVTSGDRPAAAFPIEQGNRWGLIDGAGKVCVEANYEAVGEPHNGLAEFLRDGKVGFLDTSGAVVIPAQYPPELFRRFSGGLAHVKVEGKYGYIDRAGNMTIEPRFDQAAPFFEGLGNVKIDGKWGYVDMAGKVVIEPRFLHGSNFFEGMARIAVEGSSGFIDRTGRFVIEPSFESAGVFSEGLAAVKLNGRHGFINQRGEMVIAPQYGDARAFSEGLAAVKTATSWDSSTAPETGSPRRNMTKPARSPEVLPRFEKRDGGATSTRKEGPCSRLHCPMPGRSGMGWRGSRSHPGTGATWIRKGSSSGARNALRGSTSWRQIRTPTALNSWWRCVNLPC